MPERARLGHAAAGMTPRAPRASQSPPTLTGQLAVVTGAGSGIGRATALALAAEGAQVAACDLDAGRLASLAADLGPRADVVQRVDVADRAAMRAFADAVHAGGRVVDLLVNNAGVGLGGDFLATSLEDWDWVVGVNLRGVVHGCHFFAPPMVARGAGGHVVNVSSILGLYGAPRTSAYAATKFAVLGLSQALRAELAAHHIGVTAVCPGLIATSIIDDGRIVGGLAGRRSEVQAAFRRGAAPERVARAILGAARTNPAVVTVGRDAWALRALARWAPAAAARLGAAIARHVGAG
jgi:NADP-dependent 3-hydroxy acid dehydrogenase YdfG